MVGLVVPEKVDLSGNEYPCVSVLASAPAHRGKEKMLKAGVDTFACTSVIDVGVARDLGLTLNQPHRNLRAIDGSPLKILATAEVALRLAGFGKKSMISTVIPVTVVARLEIPGIGILLGATAHTQLGNSIHVDLSTNVATYGGMPLAVVGAVVQDDSTLITREKDFDLFFGNGVWSFEWKWLDESSLPRLPAHLPAIYKKNWFNEKILTVARQELEQWIDEGIMTHVGSVVSMPHRRWVPLNMILQEHKSTPVRVTLDLVPLNKLIKCTDEKSTNEVCHDALLAFRRRGTGFMVDVKRAYLQVKLNSEAQKEFLTINVFGDLYQLNVLPFGLSIGPKLLFKILEHVLGPLASEGLVWYRDDIMCPQHMLDVVVDTLKANGFATKPPVEIKIGMNIPTRILGLTVYSENGKLMWKREEKEADLWVLKDFSIRELASWINRIVQAPVCGWLRPVASKLKSLVGTYAAERGWDGSIGDLKEVRDLARLIEKRLPGSNPMKGVWQVPGLDHEYIVYTDASQEFLGVVICEDSGEALYDYSRRVKGVPQINSLELDAVLWGIQICLDLSIKKVRFMCDNKATISWVKRVLDDENVKVSGMYSKLLVRRLEVIRAMIMEYKLEFRIEYVSTSLNLADTLSRIPGSRLVGAVLVPRPAVVAYPRTLRRWSAGQLGPSMLIRELHAELIHPPDKRIIDICKQLGVEIDHIILQEIKTMRESCSMCSLKQARLTKWESTGIAHQPGEVFIDTFHCNGGDFAGFVTIVDAETRVCSIELFESHVNAGVVIRALLKFFSTYWVPDIIRSDNGSEFVNSEVQTLIESFNIRHHRGSVSHPQSQGLVERVQRTLLSLLRLQNPDIDWHIRALKALAVYLRSPHSGAGNRTPQELMIEKLRFGRVLDSLEPEIEPDMIDIADDRNSLISYDISPVGNEIPTSRFAPGDGILWKDPNAIKRKDVQPWKRGTVLEVLPRGAYRCEFQTGNRLKRRVINSELMDLDRSAVPASRNATTDEGTLQETGMRRDIMEEQPVHVIEHVIDENSSPEKFFDFDNLSQSELNFDTSGISEVQEIYVAGSEPSSPIIAPPMVTELSSRDDLRRSTRNRRKPMKFSEEN